MTGSLRRQERVLQSSGCYNLASENEEVLVCSGEELEGPVLRGFSSCSTTVPELSKGKQISEEVQLKLCGIDRAEGGCCARRVLGAGVTCMIPQEERLKLGPLRCGLNFIERYWCRENCGCGFQALRATVPEVSIRGFYRLALCY